MTEPRKAALSLLITILLFAVFVVASFGGLFDLIETRFYNPGVTSVLSREITHEAGAIEVFFTTIERWFSDSLADPAVKRSFLVDQTSADIYERSQVFAGLHEKLDGLQWVRFIDSGGNRIHYSTWQGDLIREDSETAVYRMYTDAASYMPLENLLPLADEAFRIIFDPSGNRILFSLPFYDALDAYRGLAVFSLSTSAIQTRLVAEKLGGEDKIWLIAEPLGLLHNVPEDNKTGVLETVAESWKQSGVTKQVSVSTLESGGGTRLVLLAAKTLQGIYIGHLVNETVFVFPPSLKMLLLVLFFISTFLVLFLVANIRQDPMVVVQTRLKNLQISLIKEYYEQKTDIELSRWGMELMQQREEIRDELKSGLKTKVSKKQEQEINAYIDKSWDDLLAVIGGRLERTVNEEEIHFSLNRLTNMLYSLVEDGAFAQNGKSLPSSMASPEPDGDRLATGTAVFMDEETGYSAKETEGFSAANPSGDTIPANGFDEITDSTSFAAENEDIGELEEVEELIPIEDEVFPGAATAGEPANSVEEIEEFETLESLDEEETPSSAPPSNIDKIAMQVEWSETRDEEEEPLAIELEVSSPFSPPPSTPKPTFTEKKVFDDDAAVSLEHSDSFEAAPVLHNPLTQISIPFTVGENRGLARRASLINMADQNSLPPADIIREQDGIAYIRESVLRPTADEEKNLDPRMKSLVDSVLKQAEKEF